MTPTRQGSYRLFRLAGIDVFLHWSWFLVAAYEVTDRAGRYTSLTWNVLEYVSLFGIVLMHEFGHALACRQVGGKANQIVLWPLGGVAYVAPPQRPGAMLWSIAAGPLVNVALLPVLTLLWLVSRSWGWEETMPNTAAYLWHLNIINGILLGFNLLPVYPLDGGQMLRSLLWFALGRTRSLMVTSVLGMVGVVLLFLIALWMRSLPFGIMTGFILLNCWGGLQQARYLARLAQVPRHAGLACPECHTAPPIGALWICGRCQARFDTFVSQAVCPQCGTDYSVTRCFDCGATHPMSEWRATPPVPPAP